MNSRIPTNTHQYNSNFVQKNTQEKLEFTPFDPYKKSCDRRLVLNRTRSYGDDPRKLIYHATLAEINEKINIFNIKESYSKNFLPSYSAFNNQFIYHINKNISVGKFLAFLQDEISKDETLTLKNKNFSDYFKNLENNKPLIDKLLNFPYSLNLLHKKNSNNNKQKINRPNVNETQSTSSSAHPYLRQVGLFSLDNSAQESNKIEEPASKKMRIDFLTN